ncbi:MAG: FAD:protein FMN transferase [Nitrospirae bacterium]|nr:MAG: FAD:protein FMN transferase [Nitrospirota bacterium]
MKRFIVLVLIIIAISGCTEKRSLYRQTEFVMDTIVTITYTSEKDRPAVEEAFRTLKRLETLFNAFDPASEVSRVNQNAGIVPVEVSKDTFDLITRALDISRKTTGAFDITVGAVSLLYDFEKKTIPSITEIKARLGLVGYEKVKLMDSKVFLPLKGMKIDPGGIAKGYGADRAVDVLKAHGLKHALVAVAGDIKALGTRPDGTAWRIGIRDPRGGGDDIFAIVNLPSNWAISTSGDYERYVIKDGVRYHHIIDPRTGLPARGLISVSCIGPEGTMTDSLATAVFILGRQEGEKLAESLGYGVVVVDDKGEVYVSPKAKAITEILYKPEVKGP